MKVKSTETNKSSANRGARGGAFCGPGICVLRIGKVLLTLETPLPLGCLKEFNSVVIQIAPLTTAFSNKENSYHYSEYSIAVLS